MTFLLVYLYVFHRVIFLSMAMHMHIKLMNTFAVCSCRTTRDGGLSWRTCWVGGTNIHLKLGAHQLLRSVVAKVTEVASTRVAL